MADNADLMIERCAAAGRVDLGGVLGIYRLYRFIAAIDFAKWSGSFRVGRAKNPNACTKKS
jgi:hypothetical protein